MSSHGKSSPLFVSITSGKGGVGKTVTTVNFAVAARRMGLRVLVFDGDLGLANVDVVLGLTARNSIIDVLNGHANLEDIILAGPLGIQVIPSGSGVSALANLSPIQKQQMISHLDQVTGNFDIVIIDTGAGIAPNVMLLNRVADEVVVVTTPEPHAMTDAYALIKVMSEDFGLKSCNLLVNQTRSLAEGSKVAERIADVALRFLKVDVTHLGNVPMDPQVQMAVLSRQAASELSSTTISGQAWSHAVRRILSSRQSGSRARDMKDFWKNLMWGTEGPAAVRAMA